MNRFFLIICIYNLFFLSGLHAQSDSSNTIKQTDHVLKIDSVIPKAFASKHLKFDGLDGPYIINDTLYPVNAENKLLKEVLFNRDSVCVQVDNAYADQFYVSVKSKNKILKSSHPQPKKLSVISDIEGNYNAFASFLISNNIMDQHHNWIFGKGHLVLLGDFVDRGKNVTQVLWLIYKLEQQAREKNGYVHFILGNHEVLNFHGDHRYNGGKYIKAAQEISGITDKTKALKFIYSQKSEIGKWLATKNVIEKIGDYLFVHGGLSHETLNYELSLEEINTKTRLGFDLDKNEDDEIVTFLYSGKGPFWYRGFVMDRPKYDRIKNTHLKSILKKYQAKKIVVGHTPVKNISTDYQGTVIRMDVPHGSKKYSGKTKGLLIQDGIEYIIDDHGNRTILN